MWPYARAHPKMESHVAHRNFQTVYTTRVVDLADYRNQVKTNQPPGCQSNHRIPDLADIVQVLNAEKM